MKFAGVFWAALRGKRSTALNLMNKDESKMATQLMQPPRGSSAWFFSCVDRGRNEVFMEMVDLTPALAKTILDNNPDNRNIRATKVAQYASDIAGDRWAINGEPVIIAGDGSLNDGQHRCTAVVDANRSITVPMIFGLARDTRTTIDQGAARIAADYLGMGGVSNASIIAAASRLLLSYESSNGQSLANAKYFTNGQIVERAAGDDGLTRSAKLAQHYHSSAKRFVPVSVIAFCHYILSDVDKTDADNFIEQVCLGEGLRKVDPAYVVRERLLALGRTVRDQKIEIILRGWNAFRRKASPRTLQILNTLPALV